MNATSYGILGCGSALPHTEITNHDLVSRGIDTSDAWIVERTGIRSRRIISEGESTSTLATRAARVALERSGLSALDIDLIIVATSTPDYGGFPSVACLVQEALGARQVPAFDVSAACTGFNYALNIAHQHLLTGFSKTALVIGADSLSTVVDWTDRGTCILFGDGAGAVILGAVSDGAGILSSALFSDGSDAQILKIEEGHIKMNGPAVFKSAVKRITPAILSLLSQANLTPKDIRYIIPHQANLRIINYIHEQLELDPAQVLTNLDRCGNTSAASIPIMLTEAYESGKLQQHDILVLVGFGAGFTWGANLIKWSLK